MENPPDPFSPLWAVWAVLASLPLGAAAGLAAFLRSKKEVSLRGIIGAVVYSSLLAIGVASLVFAYFPVEKWTFGTVWMAISLSILSGVGGNTTIGFAIELVKVMATIKTPK